MPKFNISLCVSQRHIITEAKFPGSQFLHWQNHGVVLFCFVFLCKMIYYWVLLQNKTRRQTKGSTELWPVHDLGSSWRVDINLSQDSYCWPICYVFPFQYWNFQFWLVKEVARTEFRYHHRDDSWHCWITNQTIVHAGVCGGGGGQSKTQHWESYLGRDLESCAILLNTNKQEWKHTISVLYCVK